MSCKLLQDPAALTSPLWYMITLTESSNKPFLLKFTFVRVFSHSNRTKKSKAEIVLEKWGWCCDKQDLVVLGISTLSLVVYGRSWYYKNYSIQKLESLAILMSVQKKVVKQRQAQNVEAQTVGFQREVSNQSKLQRAKPFHQRTRRQIWSCRICVVFVEFCVFFGVIDNWCALALPLWNKNNCFVSVYVVIMVTFIFELLFLSHIIHPDYSFPFLISSQCSTKSPLSQIHCPKRVWFET